MKIVCDKNMPYALESFSTLGEVKLISGREISAADVRDAELLITRSTTQVNAALLEGSAVRFYGSGVIGVDHIDFEVLERMGIKWATAPGCNAVSVGNYVAAALLWLGGRHGFELAGKTIGIIGAGNVGRQVCRFCTALGMRVLANDPPRQRDPADIEARAFVPLEQILAESDVISCHVPLNREGADRSVHLLGAAELAQVKKGATLINAARGEVVDNQALLEVLGHRVAHTVVDCWEGEPDYRVDLLARVDLGTPHIAGHAYEGKVNGTALVYRAACDFLSVVPSYPFTLPEPPVPLIKVNARVGGPTQQQGVRSDEDVLRELVLKVYDIASDSERLRATSAARRAERIVAFDVLRNTYPMRRLFASTRVEIEGARASLLAKIQGLDFCV